MAVFNTGQAPDIFDTRQLEIFTTINMQDPPYYNKYFYIKPATTRQTDSIRFSGLGGVFLKLEGGPIQYAIPVQGARRRVIHQTYALGYRVTMEALADAQHDVLDQQPEDLGRSHRENYEIMAAGLLDDSFDGNIHTGLDGRPLVDTAHTFLNHPSGSATTASNELSPGIPFCTEGLEAAMTNLSLTESEEGRQVGFTLTAGIVAHHPSIQHLVTTVLGSEFRTGSNFNDLNTMSTSRTGLVPLCIPHLASTDPWWIMPTPASKGSKHPLRWNMRQPLTWLPPHTDQSTQDRLYAAWTRFSVEIVSWRGVVGSQI